MTEERFQALAVGFERLSRRSPRLYRLLIVLLALGGYGYVALWLLLGLGLLATLLVLAVRAPGLLKLALPVGIFCWVLLRSLWVRLDRPGGQALDAAEAPLLHAELARLRRLGRVPRIDRVLLSDDLNASVSQVPRLGILGWPHNDLTIGMPLLLTLSPEAFRAVLAHELGHLSGRHGRMGAWIFRLRVTWVQVLGALEARRSRLVGLFRGFFRSYGPFFGAASLALAREQEREADRFSAAAAGPRAAADALVAVELAGVVLEERFWPGLGRRTVGEAEPPAGHLALMADVVREGLSAPSAGTELERRLLPRSRGGDTHPSLSERLAELGEVARVPPPFARSAAEHFLGPALGKVRTALEARWRERTKEAWAREHEEAAKRVARLEELEGQVRAGPLSAEAALERVALVEWRAGREAALPLAVALPVEHPDQAPAWFVLGRLLLAGGRPEGIAHLQRAIALDPGAELAGAQLIARYHLSLGHGDLAKPFLARAEWLGALEEAARAERAGVVVTDPLEPHGLPPGEVLALVGPVRGHPRVARLLLGRKRLTHMPQRAPVFVLGVVARRRWFRLTWSGDDRVLAREIAARIEWPGRVFVFVKNDRSRRLFRRMGKLAGAAVA
ncbi:MAG TPA: M48 family metalloprotease [Anaeromyxobacter sp.]|nr:M48 family metalloprotease [Anaeromyxobacter sp.]